MKRAFIEKQIYCATNTEAGRGAPPESPPRRRTRRARNRKIFLLSRPSRPS
nr:ORF69 [Lymantria dispar multiple nucleopolyhedrovirus]WAK98571.1 ORF69 [Lymantria dispar multiple nucleopolyhedrovirus]